MPILTLILDLSFLCSKPEPEDDDVTRHIIRLREKFGWQTVLPHHCLEHKSSKIAIQKIILKVFFFFIQFCNKRLIFKTVP